MIWGAGVGLSSKHLLVIKSWREAALRNGQLYLPTRTLCFDSQRAWYTVCVTLVYSVYQLNSADLSRSQKILDDPTFLFFCGAEAGSSSQSSIWTRNVWTDPPGNIVFALPRCSLSDSISSKSVRNSRSGCQRIAPITSPISTISRALSRITRVSFYCSTMPAWRRSKKGKNFFLLERLL